MKPSVLSKALGISIISLNVALLSLALPASAQSSTSPNSSTTDGSATSNDPTTSASPAPSNATTTGTTSAEGTTSTRSEDPDWGWLGLVGLIGLVGFIPRPSRSSVVGETGYARSQTNVDTAGDRLHQGLDQAQVKTRNLVEQVKTGVSDFQERKAQEKEIKDIKNALGRPSNRVILDRQDNVILNVGDLITNEAVERARAANMLDVLLDSVDEQAPPIMNEERSARVPGEASLEAQETSVRNHHQP